VCQREEDLYSPLLPASNEESAQEINLEPTYVPLTVGRAVDFLLARNLISEQTLVEGDLRVEAVPGRNRNLRVHASKGSSYFLKQVPPEEMKDPRLPIEAELYRLVMRDGHWGHLSPWVPRFRFYDAAELVLVTDLELDLSETEFDDQHATLGLPPLAEPLARALSACHCINPGTMQSRVDFLPQIPPGILSIGRPRPSALQYLSPAQIELIHIIQEHPMIMAAFDELHAGWTGECLVHGDVKWANVLVRPFADSGACVVKLVDWELAQLGDPAWDVGSVLHSYLLYCVLSADIPGNARPNEAAERIAAALPPFYGELRKFWNTYTCLTETSSQETPELLARSIAWCIARLVQSAYEWSQEELILPGRAAAILQLGLNMLSHPDDARRMVLGGIGE